MYLVLTKKKLQKIEELAHFGKNLKIMTSKFYTDLIFQYADPEFKKLTDEYFGSELSSVVKTGFDIKPAFGN